MDEFFYAGIIFTVIGPIFFFYGIYTFKLKRLIENIPTSKIRSIAMGLVEIYGQAIPSKGNLLKSPFSNNDCVYYKYNIDEYRSTGKSSAWITVKKGEERRLFFLKDETGSVLVNPDKAKISIPIDGTIHSSMGKDPPEPVKDFLKTQNISFEGWLLGINKRMRYMEYYIASGDYLYIMGTAADNPFVEEGTVEKGVDDVIIKKGKHDKFFFITDKSENKLLNYYKKQLYVSLGLGIFFTIIGLIWII